MGDTICTRRCVRDRRYARAVTLGLLSRVERLNNLLSYRTTVNYRDSARTPRRLSPGVACGVRGIALVRFSWLRSFIEGIDKTGSAARTCQLRGSSPTASDRASAPVLSPLRDIRYLASRYVIPWK